MTLKHLLAAAAVTVLMTGAAHAQSMTQPPADSASPAPMTTPAGDPAGTMSPSMSTDTSTEAGVTTSTTVTTPAASTGMSTDTSATLSTSTVTNGPVADTPENRAKYQPLSRAGKHTAPKGN